MAVVCNTNTFDVLLVEDDLGDAGLVRFAVRRGPYACRIHHVKDGSEAMDFLRGQGEFATAPRPDLVLLDINLPGRSGHEVLEEIKTDPRLKALPVVILTTSAADRDRTRAYSLGADSFVSKPLDIDCFTSAIHAIEKEWLGRPAGFGDQFFPGDL